LRANPALHLAAPPTLTLSADASGIAAERINRKEPPMLAARLLLCTATQTQAGAVSNTALPFLREYAS
jgi:hypothetical protein